MNRFRCALAILAWLVLGVYAQAQVESAQGTTHVTLGPSVVPLYGPWKFTVGDSPVDPATNSPLWAEPGFMWRSLKAGASPPVCPRAASRY